MRFLFRVIFCSLIMFSLLSEVAWSFSFSEYEDQEESSDSSGNNSSQLLSTLNCPAKLKSQRIAIMIGEQHRDDRHGYTGAYITVGEPDWDRRFGTQKAVYGPLIDTFNQGFRQLGLKTYSPAEITDLIAKEEQEAVLNNDIEGALSAAKRLQADFLLKGIISTKAQTNKVVKIEEVFVTVKLSLTDNAGRQIANAQMSESVFSDADTLGTVQKLVEEQSSSIVYQLFKNYCQESN